MFYLPLLVPLYVLFFLVVLKWLGAQNEVLKRSFFLSAALLATQLIGVGMAALIGLADSAVLVISIALFILVINRVLILKWWQAVLIPIGVTTASYLVVAIGFMTFFKLIAKS